MKANHYIQSTIGSPNRPLVYGAPDAPGGLPCVGGPAMTKDQAHRARAAFVTEYARHGVFEDVLHDNLTVIEA